MEQNDNTCPSLVVLGAETSLPLKDLKVCFCVDTSSSTTVSFANTCSRIDREKKIIFDMIPFLKEYSIISWNKTASIVPNVDALSPNSGTCPSTFMTCPETLNVIKKSDVMILLTDGEIGSTEIRTFCNHMLLNATHLKAIIGIIVKQSVNVMTKFRFNPAKTDISVLFPAMISNSCILFADTESHCNMWSSGVFQKNWNPNEISSETKWDEISQIYTSNIVEILIPIANANEDSNLREKGYVPLGLGVYLQPVDFLNYIPNWNDLINLPFDNICRCFRIVQNCQKLLNWINNLKIKFIKELIIPAIKNGSINYIIPNHISPDNMDTHVLSLPNNMIQNFLQNFENQDVYISILGITKTIEDDLKIQNGKNLYSVASMSSTRYNTTISR